MKYNTWIIILALINILNACQIPNKDKITFEDIKDSSNRALPAKIKNNITFYNTDNRIISTDKFNQLLAEGLYLSEQKLNIDGTEEVHLISIKEHSKKLEEQPIPDFKLVDLKGHTHTKDNIQGKVTIISFWFTASYLCTKDIQELNPLATKYANNKNFLWLAPALDKSAELSRFLRGKSWNFDFAANQEQLALKFGVLTYPTHLIINKAGEIHKAIVRHPNPNEILSHSIQELL